MTQTDFDIIVSGGGVAGLVAACAFGSQGFSVICVDPSPPITDRAAAGADLRTTAYLQPAQAFLDRIGVWPLVAQDAAPLQVMRIVDAGQERQVKRDFDASDISDAPFGWNVGNWVMRAGLVTRLSQLPNVEFLPGVATQNVMTRSAEVRVKLSDTRQVSAKLLVVAEGRDSPNRDALGIGVHRHIFDQNALSFAVSHRRPHENVSTEVHKSGGPFTLVPLPDVQGQPCSAVVWMDSVENTEALLALPPDSFNQAASERSAGVLGDLTLVSRRGSWPIITQLADRFVAERTACIAETAHVLPPIGAQGLNLSLGDIEDLLDRAIAATGEIGSSTMLRAYHAKRYPIAKTRVLGVTALNHASMADHPFARQARAIGLNAIHSISPIRKTLMRLGLGTR